MNDVCRAGFKLIEELQAQQQERLDSALVRHMQEVQLSGMEGELLPYRLNNDWTVTCLMFLCFFFLYYSINRRQKYLHQRIKTFFSNKKRSNLFDDVATESTPLFVLILTGVTCVLSGVCLFDYFLDDIPLLTEYVSPHLLLGFYILSSVLLVLYKWGTYTFTNRIFFDKERTTAWTEAYFDIIIVTGFLLFPTVLLIVFFNLSGSPSRLLILITLLLIKILLFYKCIRNFFNHFHGILHLILYFCTLEMVPDLLLWKGIVYMNKVLILKF
ncbi:DUF4271 domain-containing protein [Bacteroides caecicola]|uniref:DUF4271 domain-containing protein n=1 Tax=Bacteroides caecicola TaxID=1462569 RepID=UPI002013A64A|nr:DUF4271 domain-containing protein [Bacteroides caecicola]MCL1625946.1 DUF4271 domain-containing protein [Bacteroides caecicola]